MPGIIPLETLIGLSPRDLMVMLRKGESVTVLLPDPGERRAVLSLHDDAFHGEVWVMDQRISFVTCAHATALIRFVRESTL